MLSVEHSDCTIYLPIIPESGWPDDVLHAFTTKNYNYVFIDGDEIRSLPKGILYGEVKWTWSKKHAVKHCEATLGVKELVKGNPLTFKTHYYARHDNYDHNIFERDVDCIPSIKKVAEDLPICEIKK